MLLSAHTACRKLLLSVGWRSVLCHKKSDLFKVRSQKGREIACGSNVTNSAYLPANHMHVCILPNLWSSGHQHIKFTKGAMGPFL